MRSEAGGQRDRERDRGTERQAQRKRTIKRLAGTVAAPGSGSLHSTGGEMLVCDVSLPMSNKQPRVFFFSRQDPNTGERFLSLCVCALLLAFICNR